MASRIGAGIWLAIVSFGLIVALSGAELEDEIDWDNLEKQEWVDPTDMLNYDIGTQSKKRPPAQPTGKATKDIKRPYGAGKLSQRSPEKMAKPKEKSTTESFKRPLGAGRLSHRKDDAKKQKPGGQQQQQLKATAKFDPKVSDTSTERTTHSKPTQSGEKDKVSTAQARGVKPQQGMRHAVVKTEHQPTGDTSGVKIADAVPHTKVEVHRKEAKLDKIETKAESDKQPEDIGVHESTAQQEDYTESTLYRDETHQDEDEETCDCTDYAKSLAAMKGEKDRLQEELEECAAADLNPPPEQPYFKQYINVLLKNFREQGLPNKDEVTYKLNCKLSPDDIKVLERYASSKRVGIQDAHSVLVHMITGVSIVHESDITLDLPQSIREYMALAWQITSLGVVVLIGVYFYVKLNLSLAQLFFRILVILFFVSIPWNWWHLYNKEIAERQVAALQDAPPECRPEKFTLWQSVKSAFSMRTDQCAKYHEMLLVDPMWEVPPTKAIAVTFTKFLMEPLEHVGEHISRFFKASLQDLPIHLWPFVFGFSVIVAIIIIIMSFGYKLRLFYLFGLEPTPGVTNGNNGVVRQGIEEIREEIKKLADAPGVRSTPRGAPPNIPGLSADKVEEIVHHAVQAHLPPIKPTRLEPVTHQDRALPPPPTPPRKKIAMVDSQTQSTPKLGKKLSTTHVASYSYRGTEPEWPLPEKTVTRQSSVVMRDNWAQTWITSGSDGKFADLDDMTFCKMHPSWKPFQHQYFQSFFQQDPGDAGEDAGDGEGHESDTCPPSELIECGSVVSPKLMRRTPAGSRTDGICSASQTAPVDPETVGHGLSSSLGRSSVYSSNSGALNLSKK